jgi:hypothetical protein
MYVSRAPRRTAVRVAQVLAGVAAGSAMGFAVLAHFFASRWVPPQSAPWFLFLVVVYIFKDRLKESIRGGLLRFLPMLVADREEDLIDPATERDVGRGRMRLRLQSAGEQPEAIRQARYGKADALHRRLAEETTLHLHKTVTIRADRLADRHPRLRSLTEILRLHLGVWMERMDRPVSRLTGFAQGGARVVEAARTYHLHLLVRLYDPECSASILVHRRVVLTAEGILRIESPDAEEETESPPAADLRAGAFDDSVSFDFHVSP